MDDIGVVVGCSDEDWERVAAVASVAAAVVHDGLMVQCDVGGTSVDCTDDGIVVDIG